VRPGCAPLLFALFVAIAPGCASERASPECKDVCHRHARCVDQKAEAAALAASTSPGRPRGEEPAEQTKFDRSECIDVCMSLRRDPEGKKTVQQQIACVARAGDDCAAILACK
jgi:hypothetical protein